MQIFVMDSRHQVRKDASGNIHVTQISRRPHRRGTEGTEESLK
jgi:hypothetical protein